MLLTMSAGRRRQSRLVPVGVLCESCRSARASIFRAKPLCIACGKASFVPDGNSVPLDATAPAIVFCAVCDSAPAALYCAPAAAALCDACDARVHSHTGINGSTLRLVHTSIHDALVASPVCFAAPEERTTPSHRRGGKAGTQHAGGQHQNEEQPPSFEFGVCAHHLAKPEKHPHVPASTVAAAAAAAAAGEMYLLSTSLEPTEHEYRQILVNVTAAASAAARSANAVLSRSCTVPNVQPAMLPSHPLAFCQTRTHAYSQATTVVGSGPGTRKPVVSNRTEGSAAGSDDRAHSTSTASVHERPNSHGGLKWQSHSQKTWGLNASQEHDVSAVVPTASDQVRTVLTAGTRDEDQDVPDVGGFGPVDLSHFDR